MRLLWWERMMNYLTGGRPMMPLAPFYDLESKRFMTYYVDGLGRYWAAVSKWSLFRIQVSSGEVHRYLETKFTKDTVRHKMRGYSQ